MALFSGLIYIRNNIEETYECNLVKFLLGNKALIGESKYLVTIPVSYVSDKAYEFCVQKPVDALFFESENRS